MTNAMDCIGHGVCFFEVYRVGWTQDYWADTFDTRLLGGYDIFMSFKDPIENDQIPTPVWCDEAFTDKLFERINAGMGFICCHAALTDLPSDHRIITELVQSRFITHPAQCPVKFVPNGEHIILNGVKEFDFPIPDEHYVMEMIDGADVKMLGYMNSEHGRQPALWVKEYGKGKAAILTPAHFTENLICDGYMHLLMNIVKWCIEG